MSDAAVSNSGHKSGHNSGIEGAYRDKTPASAALSARAHAVLPSGIAHDARYLKPYTLYIDHAAGAHKWDVDGNRYVDYFGGHGALLLGHCHPDVAAAAAEAMAAGTHFGANHPREVAWAEQVIAMVPSVERVRFTSSGTEATLMALRLARAHTGRSKIVRFKTHFHGWHDHMSGGLSDHFDGTPTAGVIGPVASHIVLASPTDISEVRTILASDPDIAAVICEPTGASFGMVPMSPEFTAELRELTEKAGALLIFDEVVTGFRCAPGGAQEAYGVTPDITTMAKIVAGGLPGGAVGGRQDIFDLLDYDRAAAKGQEKIYHPGTFNANPVTAASGLKTLQIIATTDACARANASATWLRGRLNEILEEAQVPWAVYGSFSGFHIFTNPAGDAITPTRFDPTHASYETLKARQPLVVTKLRLAMSIGGADISGTPGGLLSAMHSREDLELTAEAFAAAIGMLKRDGEL